MTVVSTTQRNDYIGSGISGPYAYTYRIFAATDLAVLQQDTQGNLSTLAYPADYSVTGVGNRTGGTIALTNALPNGYRLSVQRNPALLQSRSVRNQGPFFPESVEDALDFLVMIDQRQQDAIDRSLRLPAIMNPASANMEIASFLPSYYLRVKADGSGVEGVIDVIADSGFVQSGIGAVHRTANSKMADIVSVFDFGAVGDGVTDDAAAITAALGSGNRFVYFPALPAGRSYAIRSSITIPGGTTILAAGSSITALVAMTSVVQIAGSESKVSGLTFDANHLALYGVTFATGEHATFSHVNFINAKLDGVYGGVSGINDSIRFYQCQARNNGTTTTAGTCSTTNGSGNISFSTPFDPTIVRPGDFIRITGIADPIEIDAITDATHVVSSIPLGTTLAGAAFTIYSGNGWNINAHSDNNIWGLHECYAVSNACANLMVRSLYGPNVTNFQGDSALLGFHHGQRGGVHTSAPIGTVLLNPYFEGNTRDLSFANSNGLTIIEPRYATGPLVQDTQGYSTVVILQLGKLQRWDPNLATPALQCREYTTLVSGNSGGGVADGATWTLPVTGVDCREGVGRVFVQASGGGENGAIIDAVTTSVSARTNTGCTVTVRNKGGAVQILHADVAVYAG